MNLNDLFNEEKVRLDPKCWTGKKIGNPKTKMKGGTRVNNCVPVEEGLDEAHHGSLLNPKKGQFASVMFQSEWDTNPQIDYYDNLDDAKFETENASAHHGSVYAWNGARWVRKMSATERTGGSGFGNYGSWEENKQGVAEEYELAGVGVAYELGRRAYKERKTARDNPYSATREARKNDEWAKGLERGKHDANDARHFRSSVREQGVAEGLAQDEAEEDSGWRAEFVNEINYNTFEVKLTNTRSKESANFIVRPVDMVSYGPTLSIETMDVHDLQTGQTESWTNDDPAPEGPIAYAISGLFYDDKQLQQKLQNIVDTHDTKGQDMMPGLEKRRSIGQEVDADTYVDSGEKTQAAMAKMKKGVAEKLGDNRPKLGSKRDAGKSVRKWRSARGLDETGRTNEGGDVFMANIKDTPEYKAGLATGKLPVPHPEGTQQYASYYKGVIDKASPTLNKVGEGELDEGWKSALGAAALAGTMAMGAGGASARVMPGDDPGINRLTGKPIATQQTTDTAPAKAEAPTGFSKEYLQKAANPDRFGRFLISVEKAQELLKQMNEGDKKAAQPEADYGDDYQDMVARVKKLAGLGPLKTVYDPAKRVYRNVPTAVQPKR